MELIHRINISRFPFIRDFRTKYAHILINKEKIIIKIKDKEIKMLDASIRRIRISNGSRIKQTKKITAGIECQIVPEYLRVSAINSIDSDDITPKMLVHDIKLNLKYSIKPQI